MENNRKIKPENIEYILIKDPVKKSGHIVNWHIDLVKALQSHSLKQVLRTLQKLVTKYHDSCLMLDRISDPHYQTVLMMSGGICQYKKHSLKFIAQYLEWDREDVLKLVIFLLNQMEPELIDSPTYSGKLLITEDVLILNSMANMRFS